MLLLTFYFTVVHSVQPFIMRSLIHVVNPTTTSKWFPISGRHRVTQPTHVLYATFLIHRGIVLMVYYFTIKLYCLLLNRWSLLIWFAWGRISWLYSFLRVVIISINLFVYFIHFKSCDGNKERNGFFSSLYIMLH